MPKFLKIDYATNKVDEAEVNHEMTEGLDILRVHNEDWGYSTEFPKNLYSIPRHTGKKEEV